MDMAGQLQAMVNLLAIFPLLSRLSSPAFLFFSPRFFMISFLLYFSTVFTHVSLVLQIYLEKHAPSKGPPHKYILHPISGVLKLLLNKSNLPDRNNPKYKMRFEFDDVMVELGPSQYQTIMDVVDWFSRIKKAEKVCSRSFRSLRVSSLHIIVMLSIYITV